jgi:transcriptional regulator with XRE-family HTH domain
MTIAFDDGSMLATDFFKSLGRPEPTTGRVMRSWRKCEELTLEVVAKQLGISKQLLSSYERDEKRPSIQRLMEICQIIGMDPAMILHFRIKDEIRGFGYELKKIVLEPIQPKTDKAS